MQNKLDLAMKVAKNLNTKDMREIGFESCTIDGIRFTAVKMDNEFSVTAETKCNGNRIIISHNDSKLLLHGIATCVMNMCGKTGEWTFNSIHEEIEKEKEKDIEFTMFCESLGYEN